MSVRGRSGLTALLVSFAAIAVVSACDGDEADGGGDEAGSGGTPVAGATASGGGAGRGGASSSGGTGGSGSGLAPGSGGSRNVAGAAGRGGGPAAGGTTANAGRSGSMNGSAGGEPPGGDTGDSPYEIECHGDTATCGNPTSLLCLGIRVGTEVFGYSCSNECASDADCSARPASADAAAGCVDFVNKKYCLLVCKNGDEQASCPTGMYCYVYEGAPTGYCLWH